MTLDGRTIVEESEITRIAIHIDPNKNGRLLTSLSRGINRGNEQLQFASLFLSASIFQWEKPYELRVVIARS